jgi:3',5'-cyclic AMP phosphodiesterase CpdA
VHAGDLSTDGALRPDDLADARAALDRVPAPVAVVPGNHDVGDGAAWSRGPAEAVVTDDTISRYRAAVGSDRFSVAVGRWHLLGLDAQLLGSAEDGRDAAGGDGPDGDAGDARDAEAEQWAWLGAEVRRVPSGTPVGIVLHKPLVPPPGEEPAPHRYVPGHAGRRLLALVAGLDVRVVVSGHVHQALDHRRAGLRHVWAPSCWGALPDRLQRVIGAKRVGAVALALHDDGGVDVTEVRLPGVGDVVIGTDVPDPYELEGLAD